jgi:hypothetical protein
MNAALPIDIEPATEEQIKRIYDLSDKYFLKFDKEIEFESVTVDDADFLIEFLGGVTGLNTAPYSDAIWLYHYYIDTTFELVDDPLLHEVLEARPELRPY